MGFVHLFQRNVFGKCCYSSAVIKERAGSSCRNAGKQYNERRIFPFVAEVRKWIEAGGDRKQAVDDAVDVCIEQGILRDILIRERTAIVNMVLSCTKNNMRDSSKGVRTAGEAAARR